ncbi:MAG: cupin domain-containing protein [Armatimonadota bacterium]|jgi:mannose-6-phosphate isomerase-like protein (cupin superfamily)|nr:cupin domain-containing protein [Armatimonadota bacterium]
MDAQVWDAFRVADAMDGPAQQFQRLLGRPDLTVGVLRVLPGGLDLQGTHQQDEVYACVGGRGLVRLGDRDVPVGPGAVIFVPAGVPHRFHGNKEPLVLAYVLVPPAG